MLKTIAVILFFLCMAGVAFAGDVVIKLHLVNEEGIGKEIGMVRASDSKFGLLLTPKLSDLPPGLQRFHVNENPDCSHPMKEGKAVRPLREAGINQVPQAGMTSFTVTAILATSRPCTQTPMER